MQEFKKKKNEACYLRTIHSVWSKPSLCGLSMNFVDLSNKIQTDNDRLETAFSISNDIPALSRKLALDIKLKGTSDFTSQHLYWSL